MTDHDDLIWLAGAQPAVTPPDAAATSRARTALLAHAAAPAPAPAPAPERALRARPARRWQRPARVLALAGAAATTVAAVGVLPFVGGGDGGVAPVQANAAPLVRLAERVSAEPAPEGDATLVMRHQAYPTGPPIDGYDLYTDGGGYFYGATMSDMRVALAGDDSIGRSTALEIAAAEGASTATDLGAARQRMIDATWWPTPAAERTAPPAAPAKAVPMRGRISAPVGSAARQAEDDNRVWMGVMDSLTAGAGRSAVRAGALRLAATIPTVSVSYEPDGSGAPDLVIRNAGFPDDYAETLVVDGDTGIPLRMVGGTTGETPGVVVTYRVRRVATSALARG